MKKKVMLLSENDAERRMFKYGLHYPGWELVEVMQFKKAIPEIRQAVYSLIVVIEETPFVGNKLEELLLIRDEAAAPLILFTQKLTDEQHIELLERGIDRIFPIPYNMNILPAQVKAILRREKATLPRTYLPSLSYDDLSIDPKQLSIIHSNGRTTALTPLEFDCLYLLMSRPNQIYPVEELGRYLRGYTNSETSIRKAIERIRVKIEKDPKEPQWICNKPRLGYYFASGTVN